MTELIIKYAEPSAEMDRAVIPSEVVGTLVRCKDCRYRNGKVNRKGFEVCDATGMDITDNDYCSWGERREK